MKTILKLSSITIGILFALNTYAGIQYDFLAKNGSVEFVTKGWPSLIKIKGEADGVTGQLIEKNGKVNGTLSFQLDKLKTGIELRDDHMKNKYLEVKKFPTASFTLKDFQLEDAKKTKFSGKMTIHGQTETVNGTIHFKRKKGQVVSIKAVIPMKLGDFKIDIPSYQGITVAEKVTVTIESQVASTEIKNMAQN